MISYFKIKKYRFLVLFLLLASNYYCNSQNLLAVDGLENPNGRPILVKLNVTNASPECTSRTIALNIGKLTYIPSSNIIPAETIVTSTIASGETTLFITSFRNETGGFSRTLTIGAQFVPGTCDDTKQEITASINFTGCNATPIQASPVTVISKTPNSVTVDLFRDYSETKAEPYCLRKTIKYKLTASNVGNKGFDITNAQIFLELDKCAAIAIYKENTYDSVNPDITSTPGTTTQNAVFKIVDLKVSPNNMYLRYDVYVSYPCLDGINDCSSGVKNLSAWVKGKSCGSDITINSPVVKTQITTSSTTCGDLSCTTGGIYDDAALAVNQSIILPCVTSCNSKVYIYNYLYIPPFSPSYTNRAFIVDIPPGLDVTSVYSPTSPCGDTYVVKYINSMGEKSSTPYPGSLTRKVEFTTACSSSVPSTTFIVNISYNAQTPPLPETELSFGYKFTSDQKMISGTGVQRIQKCTPAMYVSHQVKKAAEIVSDDNYNANGVPGEIFTYRLNIYNRGSTGDSNIIITDKLNENLEYAGGFKYIYDNAKYENLTGAGFTIPDLGTVAVAVPKIGESGIIRLSGFKFPCTNKILYVEFNVRIKDNVKSGTVIPNACFFGSSGYSYDITNITVIPFTYVTAKMYAKCVLSNEWNDKGINVKNGEEIDFKMRFTNAGSDPVMLSQLINLKPQPSDQYEFGSSSRNSTFKINYNCELPKISTNLTAIPAVDFKYAQNTVNMDRDMLCPPQASGNVPNWTAPCDFNTNWLKATFPTNFTLNPGDYIELVYRGKVFGDKGIAHNSFAFKVVGSNGDCNILSDNSNLLTLTNDDMGCTSCVPVDGKIKDIK